MISFRALSEEDFYRLYQTLVEAFSDYIVPMQPEFETLKRSFLIEGVELDCSFGAFDSDKMVGFTANGIGQWKGKTTAYDAGTGVIPAYRRRGISRRMFEYIFPVLRARRIEQYLLEVIVENTPALALYKNLGFQIEREFSVFRREKILFSETSSSRQNIEIKEIENPDWNFLQSFWSYRPSWQNSVDALKRISANAAIKKKVLGVFFEDELVGYGIVFLNSGNIPQIAIAENFRRKGFGNALLKALQRQTDTPLKAYNIDEKAADVASFLRANGFSLLTRQYEMLLKL